MIHMAVIFKCREDEVTPRRKDAVIRCVDDIVVHSLLRMPDGYMRYKDSAPLRKDGVLAFGTLEALRGGVSLHVKDPNVIPAPGGRARQFDSNRRDMMDALSALTDLLNDSGVPRTTPQMMRLPEFYQAPEAGGMPPVDCGNQQLRRFALQFASQPNESLLDSGVWPIAVEAGVVESVTHDSDLHELAIVVRGTKGSCLAYRFPGFAFPIVEANSAVGTGDPLARPLAARRMWFSWNDLERELEKLYPGCGQEFLLTCFLGAGLFQGSADGQDMSVSAEGQMYWPVAYMQPEAIAWDRVVTVLPPAQHLVGESLSRDFIVKTPRIVLDMGTNPFRTSRMESMESESAAKMQ